MATPRTPERAKAVLDRAAKMRGFKPSILDRRLFDTQMRVPGRTPAPFPGVDFLGHDNVINRGVQDIPLHAIKTHQPSMSLAQAKGKVDALAQGQTLKPAQLLHHNGQYYTLDGNHGITARRALGQVSTKATVLEMRPAAAPALATTKPVPGKPTGMLGRVGQVGLPLAVGAAAVIAASRAAKAGESKATIATEATKEATRTAAPGLAIGGGLAGAAKLGLIGAGTALKVGSGLGIAAAGVGAAAYGIDAYRRGESASGIAKAVGWGAVNSIVPIDLARQAVRDVTGGTGTPAPLSSGQAAAFHQANAHYNSLHMQDAPQRPDGNHNRGTRNESNLKAIIAARQQRAAEATP